MKRKFYIGYDSGVIEFDPPVENHPLDGFPQLDLKETLSAEQYQKLRSIDNEELVERYC